MIRKISLQTSGIGKISTGVSTFPQNLFVFFFAGGLWTHDNSQSRTKLKFGVFHTQEQQSTKHKIGIHHRLGYTQSTLGMLREGVVP